MNCVDGFNIQLIESPEYEKSDFYLLAVVFEGLLRVWVTKIAKPRTDREYPWSVERRGETISE